MHREAVRCVGPLRLTLCVPSSFTLHPRRSDRPGPRSLRQTSSSRALDLARLPLVTFLFAYTSVLRLPSTSDRVRSECVRPTHSVINAHRRDHLAYGCLYAYMPKVMPSQHRATGNAIAVGCNRFAGVTSTLVNVNTTSRDHRRPSTPARERSTATQPGRPPRSPRSDQTALEASQDHLDLYCTRIQRIRRACPSSPTEKHRDLASSFRRLRSLRRTLLMRRDALSRNKRRAGLEPTMGDQDGRAAKGNRDRSRFEAQCGARTRDSLISIRSRRRDDPFPRKFFVRVRYSTD